MYTFCSQIDDTSYTFRQDEEKRRKKGPHSTWESKSCLKNAQVWEKITTSSNPRSDALIATSASLSKPPHQHLLQMFLDIHHWFFFHLCFFFILLFYFVFFFFALLGFVTTPLHPQTSITNEYIHLLITYQYIGHLFLFCCRPKREMNKSLPIYSFNFSIIIIFFSSLFSCIYKSY